MGNVLLFVGRMDSYCVVTTVFNEELAKSKNITVLHFLMHQGKSPHSHVKSDFCTIMLFREIITRKLLRIGLRPLQSETHPLQAIWVWLFNLLQSWTDSLNHPNQTG